MNESADLERRPTRKAPSQENPMNTDDNQLQAITMVRRTLLTLARQEDLLAADEAATVPYWMPRSPDVAAHRAAARVLRSAADDFLQAG
jgi:hypothetical protein